MTLVHQATQVCYYINSDAPGFLEALTRLKPLL